MINRKYSLSVFLPPLVAALVVVFLFWGAVPLHAQNVQVDLSSTSDLCGGAECFNAPGIFADGVMYFGISYMDGGTECTPVAPFTTCPAAYGAQQLFGSAYNPSSTTPQSLTIGGVPFNFGPVNTVTCGASAEPACIPDTVFLTTSGVDVTLLPAQQTVYSTMIMLGTAVNGHHTGTVTINYTTGAPTVFDQTFSDWCSFGGNPNESIAVAGFERIVANGTPIGPDCNLYAYTYPLDVTRILQGMTLTYTDTNANGAAAYALAVTLKPPSYTVDAAQAAPASITAGSSTTATVTVAPQPGYVGTVNLSCSISPAIMGDPPTAATAPSCSLSPTSVTVTAGEASPPTTTVTFTSAAPASAMVRPSSRIFYALWLLLPGLAFAGFSLGSRGSRPKKFLGLMLLGLLLAGLLVIPACVSTTQLGNVGTPPGQYTVAITGLDTNGLTQASNPSGTTNAVTVTVTDN